MYVLELAGQDDEFAAYEAEHAASDVSTLGPGLATARGISDRFDNLAYTHRASELVGRADATVEDAALLLSAATLDREGSVAVRAVDVRGTTDIDTQAAEREIGNVLVDRGFDIDLDDPDHELRALFTSGEGGTCLLGWLAGETERDFGQRKPTDRPFFQPGSMDPMLARALVNIAGCRPGATLVDPMCGTGGILIEAGLLGARAVGLDVQAKMTRGARQNLAAALDEGWDVVRGDGQSLPFEDNAVDAVVFDAPYGRQSKIEGEIGELMMGTLREARRIAPRCVVVGDKPWTRPANGVGWTTEAVFSRRVHKSLTRYIVVLRR